mmetsp:Transcript_5921/g.9090  ORF Transcript_5921/g.9090 Transcript_5921/m.9090 type:complete len:278 (-) Transcript_5921:213-1046(-)
MMAHPFVVSNVKLFLPSNHQHAVNAPQVKLVREEKNINQDIHLVDAVDLERPDSLIPQVEQSSHSLEHEADCSQMEELQGSLHSNPTLYAVNTIFYGGKFDSARRHIPFPAIPIRTPPRSVSPKIQDNITDSGDPAFEPVSFDPNAFLCGENSHQQGPPLLYCPKPLIATPSSSKALAISSKSTKNKVSNPSRKRSVKPFKLSTSNRTKRQAVPRHLRKIDRSPMKKSPKKPTKTRMPSLETNKRAQLVRRRLNADFQLMYQTIGDRLQELGYYRHC